MRANVEKKSDLFQRGKRNQKLFPCDIAGIIERKKIFLLQLSKKDSQKLYGFKGSGYFCFYEKVPKSCLFFMHGKTPRRIYCIGIAASLEAEEKRESL